MLANRATTAKKTRKIAVNKRGKEYSFSKMLAERNQPIVAVGAWVEDGEEFEEHPCDLASYTDELQAEKQRENEETLRRFQAQVRHRVAVISKRRRQEVHSLASVNMGIPKRVPGKANINEVLDSTRQVRLKLAACQTSQSTDETSESSTDSSKISLARHMTECDALREEEEEEDFEDDDEEEDEYRSHPRHPTSACEWDAAMSDSRISKILWTLQDQEELRRQVLFYTPVAVPDAPPPLHEHRAAARQRTQPAPEAPEEDSEDQSGQGKGSPGRGAAAGAYPAAHTCPAAPRGARDAHPGAPQAGGRRESGLS
ncbi:uncharacterized protein ccdc15 isoform X4 [Syngnathus scovelli]|uniref:uncharacterized protein ccdc15 isoform X4 n=1 Tax=Syngnathus scovelli TaxID=161590 RepID=UPI00210F5950|nr:bromodomain-containing protein 2 isoform X4 [Syngnathus scovelli]